MTMQSLMRLAAGVLAVAIAGCGASPAPSPPSQSTIVLEVDVTDTVHKILSVRESIPVEPGRLELAFPQWLPGHHAPDGRVKDLAGLVIRCHGQLLPWRRDSQDTYRFIVDVPPTATTLELRFDYLSDLKPADGGAFSSPQMVRLNWNTAVLYPAKSAAGALRVLPSLRIPTGWQAVGALDVESESDGVLRYRETTLETLVDSPIFAGQFVRSYELGGGDKPLTLDVIAQSASATNVADSVLDAHRRAFEQVVKLFGSRPYDHYDFLVSLSSRLSGEGVEHHQSTSASLPPNYFTDPAQTTITMMPLIHEFVHSWNGKLHRPVGLAIPAFNTPMQGDLLWVYEGLTSYLGKILTARGGAWSASLGRDVFAETAANFDHVPGRTWRSLQDTTNSPVAGLSSNWSSWTRGSDYYDESDLLWLEVDTRIRQLSGGKRSLDDFCRSFLGGGDSDHAVRTYRFEDLIAALNRVQPFDWADLIKSRLESTAPKTFKEGLVRGGYELVYGSSPSEWIALLQAQRKVLKLDYSIGAAVSNDGVVRSVRWGQPAFDAGLLPGDKILEVAGRPYSQEALLSAIAATAAGDAGPLTFTVEGDDGRRVLAMRYEGGLRYAHLAPIADAPPLLDEILRPLP